VQGNSFCGTGTLAGAKVHSAGSCQKAATLQKIFWKKTGTGEGAPVPHILHY